MMIMKPGSSISQSVLGAGSAIPIVTFATQQVGTSNLKIANSADTTDLVAWSFLAADNGTPLNLYMPINKTAGAGGTLNILLQADSLTVPSGTTLATFSIAVSAIATSSAATVEYNLTSTGSALVSGTKYWLVVGSTGLTGAVNINGFFTNTSIASKETKFSADSGTSWGADSTGIDLRYRLTT